MQEFICGSNDLKNVEQKKQQQQHRNGKLKFFYRNNKFLTPTLHRMLCSALIQPHFHYACSTWYPNLDEKLENEIKSRKVFVSIFY